MVALRPLARALVHAGIGYREFAEISKTAFVYGDKPGSKLTKAQKLAVETIDQAGLEKLLADQ